MQHILDAIQAARRPEAPRRTSRTSSSPTPTAPRPSTRTRSTCSRDRRKEKDPRKSLHVEDVALPELGPGEAFVAVMASAINYNTVWTSIFEPVSTFGFLERYGRVSPLDQAPRPALPRGRLRPGRRRAGHRCRRDQVEAGHRVVAHCLSVELEEPDGHNDTMLDPQQRIWGFETNFGGLADVALVKANQLMPKPAHLTWEEAASPGLVNCTAYRQLVSKNGGDMKQGDNVLIWGASGGLGGFATQYALNGGANPVCVVSNEEKAEIARSMGAEMIINRSEEGYRFWKDEHTQDPKEWRASAPRSVSSPAARTSTSSSSTRAARPSARRSTSPARAARSPPVRPPAATCTSTTTATCG